MSTQSKPHLTPEQYLEIERTAEFKSEYCRGEMFAMSGASRVHNLIAVNAAALIHQQLRGRPCEAYPSDMRISVGSTGLYTYPDVNVVYGEPRFLDGTFDTLTNPTVLVEILSESTEAYDRGAKFGMYRSLESLAEYVLISSLRVSAELFTRQPDGLWLLNAKSGLEDCLDLKSIDCRLRLSDLYEKVEFSQTGAVITPHRS